jgi:hypothetical protein
MNFEPITQNAPHDPANHTRRIFIVSLLRGRLAQANEGRMQTRMRALLATLGWFPTP